MTLSGTGSILDDVTLTMHRRGTALVQLDAVEGIYASAYPSRPIAKARRTSASSAQDGHTA